VADTVIITGEKTVTVVTVGVQGPAGISGSSIPATNATLGGVIVGANLSITGNGVLSVADTFQPKLANTTYGLTDTGVPYTPGYSSYYVNGDHVTSGLKKSYIGLRGERVLSTGAYLDPDQYAMGSYLYNPNGTLESATSVETDGSTLSFQSSNTQQFSFIAAQPGFAFINASNATSQTNLHLGGGVISGNAQGGYFRLRGNLGGTGDNSQDYQLAFGPTSGFDRGICFQQAALKSTIGFQYAYTDSSISYNMTNGLVFDNTTGLGGFTGSPGSYTSFQHTTDAVISGVRTGTEIRASRNKAELFYLNISPVYTSNSILTQGYADTRYQAVGSYLTSANLTFANLTGTPTTLAGYGITDGLTSANLTSYLTISSANATYAVLGHTHSIANVTGLQTALDAKLPSANFTYANITGAPNLTVYLTTANASTTYQTLGNYATTSCLTFANLTGKPTTLSGYGITDGLTSANLTPYLTISSANATYAVLGHTHSIANVTGLQTALDAKLETANFTYANLTGKPSTFAPSAHTHAISEVTGLQTALDAKLPSANFTYANITGTPNLTVYLTTANATATYQPLGNYATTSCLTFANITGKPTTLSGYGITDGYSTSNPSGYITAGSNSFTGSQNLQDNELIRAKIRDYSETVSSPTISSGTLVLNLETSNIFTVSLNAAITTLTISNPPASGSGGSFTLIFTADGTARAVTWPAAIKWAGGTAPTITSTSGKVDSFAFFTSNGGTNWIGFVGGQNF
jgi:hypothetical protein